MNTKETLIKEISNLQNELIKEYTQTRKNKVKNQLDILIPNIGLVSNEDLKTIVEGLIDVSMYEEAVNLVAEKFNIKLKVKDVEYKLMQWDKTQQRYVFKLQLSRGKKSYTFEFGQSIAQGSNEPTLYDVLTCLQKYDVGTFEDFCDDFGYNAYDENTGKMHKENNRVYKALLKEFQAVERLFNSDELEVLQMIQ